MDDKTKKALELALSFVKSHHSNDCDGGSICGGCKTKEAIEDVLFGITQTESVIDQETGRIRLKRVS